MAGTQTTFSVAKVEPQSVTLCLWTCSGFWVQGLLGPPCRGAPCPWRLGFLDQRAREGAQAGRLVWAPPTTGARALLCQRPGRARVQGQKKAPAPKGPRAKGAVPSMKNFFKLEAPKRRQSHQKASKASNAKMRFLNIENNGFRHPCPQ